MNKDIFLMIIACLLGCLTDNYALNAADIQVVYGKNSTWVERHASDEFARYAGELTGKSISVVEEKDSMNYSDHLILIGTPETNGLVSKYSARAGARFNDLDPDMDGFLIKSYKDGRKSIVILGGNKMRGTLYAVYDYLQRYCGIGMFCDGDRIPKRGELMFEGIDFLANPRFKYRKENMFGAGHYCLRKYNVRFWKLEDHKFNSDWWMKAKLNESDSVETGAGWTLKNEAIKEVFRDILTEKDKDDLNSSIYDCWPYEYRWKIDKEAFEYKDKLQMYVEPWCPVNIPEWFIKNHPEINFDDNVLKEKFADVFLRKVKEHFPPRHHLYGSPFWYKSKKEGIQGEWVDNFPSLAEEWTMAINKIRKIDPDPTTSIRADFGWYLHWHPDKWTKEDVKMFFNLLPKDGLWIDDYSTDKMDRPSYMRYGYFYGTKWSFGAFWNTAMDNPHGDYYDVLHKAQAIAEDPQASNCIAFRLHMENQGTDPMYRYFLSKLAWNPSDVTIDGFLKEWVRLRYGEEKAGNLYRSMKYLIPALRLNIFRNVPGNGGGVLPLYRYSMKSGYDKFNQFGMVEEGIESIPYFREALRLALLESERQKGNIFYETDMINISRTYLGKFFDYYYALMALDAELGDMGDMEKFHQKAAGCLDWIEKILSNRRDYSIEETVAYAEDTPIKKDGPTMSPSGNAFSNMHELVKGGSFNYANVDSYEQMHFYYKPMFERQVKKWKNEPCVSEEEIKQSWINGKTAVPEEFRYKKDTIEAIKESCTKLDKEFPSFKEINDRLVKLGRVKK